MADKEEEGKEECPDFWIDPHQETQEDAHEFLKRLGKESGDILYDANLFAAIESSWVQDSHPENGGPVSNEVAMKLTAQTSFYIQLQTYNLLKEILAEIKGSKKK